MQKDFYTVEELADKLQVHWQTILNYIRSGKLEAIKLGRGYRIKREAFEAFIQQQSTKGGKK